MPKLTDTQTIILSRAATRPGNLAMPLPEGLSALGGIVVGVISGRVVTANIGGREVEVGPGQFLLTLTDGTQILLPQPPGFLKLNPIPDPTELCDA